MKLLRNLLTLLQVNLNDRFSLYTLRFLKIRK